MSRDNYSRHRSRERSRSFSAYRHKQQFHRSSPPGPQPKHRNRSISPRAEDKFRYSRTPERNGGSARNGHGNNHSSPQRSRAPEPAKVIGVFGLHVRTSEDEIREIFERFGPIERITMIHDVKTRSFRGYCFIYYTSLRDAAEAAQATNGLEVRDKRIRVDFSYTQRPHTPTPGFYRGHRGRNRSFERHPPRRYRSRSGDRSQREFRNHRDRDRDRDYERRRSPDRSHYRSPNRRNRSPMRERRRERDRS